MRINLRVVVAAGALLLLAAVPVFSQSGTWMFEGAMNGGMSDRVLLFIDGTTVEGEVQLTQTTRSGGTTTELVQIVDGEVTWDIDGEQPMMVWFVLESGDEYYGWFGPSFNFISGYVDTGRGFMYGWYAVPDVG